MSARHYLIKFVESFFLSTALMISTAVCQYRGVFKITDNKHQLPLSEVRIFDVANFVSLSDVYGDYIPELPTLWQYKNI